MRFHFQTMLKDIHIDKNLYSLVSIGNYKPKNGIYMNIHIK